MFLIIRHAPKLSFPAPAWPPDTASSARSWCFPGLLASRQWPPPSSASVTRTKQGPFPPGALCSHAPLRYCGPLRLPCRPKPTSLPYTVWLLPPSGRTVAGLQHYNPDLPPHAASATPEVPACVRPSCQRGGRWPSPYDHRVGNFIFSFEATSEFACAAACGFAHRQLTTPDRSDAAAEDYRVTRTPPSAGL